MVYVDCFYRLMKFRSLSQHRSYLPYFMVYKQIFYFQKDLISCQIEKINETSVLKKINLETNNKICYLYKIEKMHLKKN